MGRFNFNNPFQKLNACQFVHQYKIRTFDLVLNFYVMMTFSTYLLEEIEKTKTK